MQGISWQVGDGQRVKFWELSWLEGLAPLGTIAIKYISPIDRDRPIAHYVTSDCLWNWNKLQNLLLNYACLCLASIIPPRNGNGNGMDTIFWNFSKFGKFFMSFAYNLICNSDAQSPSPFWSKIWKWKGPQCIRAFM